MIKKHKALLLLNILCLSSMTLKGMETPKAPEGPMNSEWFYDMTTTCMLANMTHQVQEWQAAAKCYEGYLKLPSLTEYDKNMARLNLAACQMAQRQSSENWASFDKLLNIAKHRRISKFFKNELCKNHANKNNKTVLVRTDQVGIGDIFHFLSAVKSFQYYMNPNVIVSVPNFLKETLASAAQAYDFTLIGAKDVQPITDYETHLIALLGHFNIEPSHMNPEKVVFTAPERAMNVVLEQITPVLDQGNNIAVVFLGENRQATLIGGRKLPLNKENHGRHLDSEPFNALLKKYPKLTLMDCGGKTSRVAIDADQKNQYMVIPDEQQAFDAIIVLARIMSAKKGIIGFGADNGPTNVFARSLDHAAQDRMTLVIPNAKEHDMRMSGEGPVYKQMISNCWVAKCEKPSDQTRVIEESYHRMLSIK